MQMRLDHWLDHVAAAARRARVRAFSAQIERVVAVGWRDKYNRTAGAGRVAAVRTRSATSLDSTATGLPEVALVPGSGAAPAWSRRFYLVSLQY